MTTGEFTKLLRQS